MTPFIPAPSTAALIASNAARVDAAQQTRFAAALAAAHTPRRNT